MWNADGFPGAAPIDLGPLIHSAPMLLFVIALIIFWRPLRRFFWRMVKLMIVLVISILGAA
jgi:Co/Zn/Cd efflux system component